MRHIRQMIAANKLDVSVYVTIWVSLIYVAAIPQVNFNRIAMAAIGITISAIASVLTYLEIKVALTKKRQTR